MDWKFRACKKCGGDLYKETSKVAVGNYGTLDDSWICLQCGCRFSAEEVSSVPVRRTV